MYHHVRFTDIYWGILDFIYTYFLAEAEDEQEGVTLESLNEVVKEQGSEEVLQTLRNSTHLCP